MPEPSPLTFLPSGRRWVVGGGLLLATWGVATSQPGPSAHGRGLVILTLLIIAALCWATWVWGHASSRVMGVVLGLLAVSGGLLTAAAPNGPSSAFAFVGVVSVAIRYGELRQYVVLAMAIVALSCGAIAYDTSATGVLAYSAGLLAALLASAARRTSILRTEEAELLLAQIQRSREEQLRAAALGERARIAREIHDVLAHSLAGLTIDLEATRMLVEQGADAGQVLARVDRAHALAREGLIETRRAIGALRGDPLRVGEQLAALVASLREGTGADAVLDVRGDVDNLPADAALAIVRVTQEALTNVRKHAAGAVVRVTTTRDSLGVTLSVDDHQDHSDPVAGGPPGPATEPTPDTPSTASRDHLSASGGGYGLQGMRERAEMLGGSLQAGPSGDGWRVELTIPLTAAPA